MSEPNPVEDQWELAEKAAMAHGGKIQYRQLDITDEEAVNRTFKEIYEECPNEDWGVLWGCWDRSTDPCGGVSGGSFQEAHGYNLYG